MSQREQFRSEWKWKVVSRTALCAAFGISRQTVQTGYITDRCDRIDPGHLDPRTSLTPGAADRPRSDSAFLDLKSPRGSVQATGRWAVATSLVR